LGSPWQRSRATSAAAVLAVLALDALLALRQISSHDLGFHLEAGNWILDGNGWPRLDPFTYTLNDRPYVDTSWGYQVLVAAIERIAGARGVVLGHMLAVVAAFSVVARTACRLAPGSLWLAPLMLAGGLAAEPRFEARPEVLSWLLLALALDRLHRYAEDGTAPWPLVPIFWAWANSHSLFLVGLGGLACFVVGLAIRDRRWDRRLAVTGLAAAVVTLVNPYGWRAPVFALGLGTRLDKANLFGQTIGEFRSPFWYLTSDELQHYLPSTVGWLAFGLALAMALAGLAARRHAARLLLLLALLPLALTMVRNVPLLVVAGLPVVAAGLAELCREWPARVRGRAGVALQLSVMALAVVFSARVFQDAYYVDARRPQRFGWSWNRLVLPVDMAAWAERANPPGRVLNHLAFGAYLMWARDEPVFIDGRLEVVGEAFFARYLEAFGSNAGLDSAVHRHGIGWVAFPYRLRPDTTFGLARHPGWRLAYVDGLASAFVRADLATDDLVDARAREILGAVASEVQVDRLPGIGPGRRSSGARAWLRGLVARREYPQERFNLGVFHYDRGEPRKAAGEFAKAIEASGGAFYEIYGNLGTALVAIGRLDAAEPCLRIALDGLPWYRFERRRRTRAQLDEVERALATRR
jgi:hypothetical protein